MEINLTYTLIIIVITFYGMVLLYQGWRILFLEEKILTLNDRIVLWLIKAFSGQEKAKRQEHEMQSMKKSRLYGFYTLIGGLISFSVGILYILGVVLGLLGL